jgi:hypothetical protein
MFTLRSRQADFVASVSSSVPLLPVLLLAVKYHYHRRCCFWQLIIAGVVVTGDKLIAGVMESLKIRNKA